MCNRVLCMRFLNGDSHFTYLRKVLEIEEPEVRRIPIQLILFKQLKLVPQSTFVEFEKKLLRHVANLFGSFKVH